jgi:hypothetical protein
MMLIDCAGGQFIETFRKPGKEPLPQDIEHLENAISAWRREVPVEMHLDSIQEWSSSNIWILVLLAMSFRLQAVFYRAVREYHHSKGDTAAMQKAARKQENAMFELGTIIQRVSMHGLACLCPLSL